MLFFIKRRRFRSYFLYSFATCIALFFVYIFLSVEFALKSGSNSDFNVTLSSNLTSSYTSNFSSRFNITSRLIEASKINLDHNLDLDLAPNAESIPFPIAPNAEPIPFPISPPNATFPHSETKDTLNVLSPLNDLQNIKLDNLSKLYETIPNLRASHLHIISQLESPFKNVASCSGILPDEAYQPILRRKFSSFSDFGYSKSRNHRTLVIVPRFGLGNFFQSFLSAYVFSLLSGRQLILYQNGPDSNVLKSLCEAFTCNHNFEFIAGKSDDEFKKFTQKFPYLIEYKRGTVQRNSLFKQNELMYVFTPRTFNEFWINDSFLYKCVNDALNCSSVWCVQSKAMASLLKGGPTTALFDVMREIIYSTKNTTLSMHPKKEYDSNLFKFDVALQIRTRARSIEVGGRGDRCRNNTLCKKLEEDRIKKDDKKIAQGVFHESSWKCIGQILMNVRKKLKQLRRSSKLKVFLATDSVNLRPRIVEYLKPYGQVYFSTGSVVHTSKSKGGFALPTMSEFFLISLSRNVISFQSHISTFGRAACLYTNRTLVGFNGITKGKCRFKVYHLGNGSEEEDFNVPQLVL